MRRNWILSAALAAALSVAAAQTTTSARHPFTAKDWASLRSAGAAAVSPDGSILYVVTFGGEHGPTHREWWTIRPDGSHGSHVSYVSKLDLPEGFNPMGFTRDGHGLY